MTLFARLFLVFVPLLIEANFHLGGVDEPFLKRLYAKLDGDCRISLELCQQQSEVIADYMHNLRYLLFNYEKSTPISMEFAERTEKVVKPLENVNSVEDATAYKEDHFDELTELYKQARNLASLMPKEEKKHWLGILDTLKDEEDI